MGFQEEQERSVARRIVDKQVSKGKRKLLKKGAKVAKKLIKAAVNRFAAVLSKVFMWLIGWIGIPAILTGFFIIISVVIISMALTAMFGTGEGLEGEEREIYNYIVKKANSTVDMNSSWERPYRVPEELIAATIQLDVFTEKEIKGVIDKMASKLAPTFDYGSYNEWKKTQILVYEDGKLISEGPIIQTDNWVSKLDHVDYWNGYTQFIYEPEETPWSSKEVITYREEKYIDKVIETYTEVIDEPYHVRELVPYEVTYQVPYVTTERVPYTETVQKKVWNGFRFVFVTETVTKFREEKVTKYRTVTETRYKEQIVQKTRKVAVEKQREVLVEKTRKIEVKTVTKTKQQYFTSRSNSTTDYSYLDNVLNSYGLGLKDKQLIEVNYLFTGKTMNYTGWLQSNGGLNGGYTYFDGTVIPGAGVPAEFMQYYRGAEKQYGVPWFVLAALHFVETGFSTHSTMISSVGAIGPMQFMPATWVGWKYNIGGGLVSSSLDITSLSVISSGRGYGKDGDGDGKADPWNNADAIYTAAAYLSANGYAQDPRKAIWAYNHADWYVNKVLQSAETFKNAATYEGGGEIPPLQPGSFMRPATGKVTSGFGSRGNSKHYGIDIGGGGRTNVPIVAAADGVVTRSYLSSSYGNVVFIKHTINGMQFETVYAHMQNRAVIEGAQVKQGQFLGYMGATGQSDGVHLHFEIHRDSWNSSKSNALNPAGFIPL
ncbi:peptidoglycan DD-metalloendopeptidase family protein [Mycobacterium sp. Z3061]|uniref:peptidoglycan DD-metalloendopeptidase family protein n=1 Tax=Mycobacterium sp. Z3061 TaxID=3073562 RepID=UPI003D81B3DE